MTKTDEIYCSLLKSIMSTGQRVPCRNGSTFRSFTLPTVVFDSTPLVTVRKTAWHKAIEEMEWFLSGDATCPANLLDWWEGQLNNENRYLAGYGEQLRKFLGADSQFDQIAALINGLRSNPFSREHVITTWNPLDMAIIKKINNNERTPACCHTTIAQFFVSETGMLSMHSYQRSADMLLGVPHNWIQSWALLLWIADQIEGIADKLIWTFGDSHVYHEPSHLAAVSQILDENTSSNLSPRLLYNGRTSAFKAADFEMIGKIPLPKTSIKPKLL